MDNSGQTSGLGLMGCRIAAGITTGMMIMIMMITRMLMLMVMKMMMLNVVNDGNGMKSCDNFDAFRYPGNPGGSTD